MGHTIKKQTKKESIQIKKKQRKYNYINKEIDEDGEVKQRICELTQEPWGSETCQGHSSPDEDLCDIFHMIAPLCTHLLLLDSYLSHQPILLITLDLIQYNNIAILFQYNKENNTIGHEPSYSGETSTNYTQRALRGVQDHNVGYEDGAIIKVLYTHMYLRDLLLIGLTNNIIEFRDV